MRANRLDHARLRSHHPLIFDHLRELFFPLSCKFRLYRYPRSDCRCWNGSRDKRILIRRLGWFCVQVYLALVFTRLERLLFLMRVGRGRGSESLFLLEMRVGYRRRMCSGNRRRSRPLLLRGGVVLCGCTQSGGM